MKVGFKAEVISESETTAEEQNQTEWAPFQSLEQGLNKNKEKTLEGYPIGKRVLIRAKK